MYMANNCKVFTPHEYVTELLDIIGYKNKLYGKSVLENSCGDGRILIEIVRRYIVSSVKEKIEPHDIIRGLERDICGVELEIGSVNQCKDNLNMVAQQYNITGVKWNIIHKNYLKTDLKRTFSYIIGNPPYIVYRDIDEEERAYLKANYKTCQDGKFDYYYAFIEKSVEETELNGTIAYIIPCSIYKNVFGWLLREYIKPYVTKIYDYTFQNKFPGTTTSSTILVLRKKKSNQMTYVDVANKEKISIKKQSLGKKWVFGQNPNPKGLYRFGDYFHISNTIATLCNDAFLLKEFSREGEYVILPDGDKIEAELVRPAISRKLGQDAFDVAIIFPYYYMNGQLERYEEQDFVEKFPCATAHLKRFSKELGERAADRRAKWFEYGRSQAITKMHKEKLVIPSILSSKIKATLVDKNVIPCAGFFVTVSGEYELKDAKTILESDDFYEYLKCIGIFTTGKSRRLTVKDIAEYTFERWG